MNYQILLGDCLDTLKTLPEQSVHTCVTSPPYFGLRDYGHEGQIGLDPTPGEFVDALVGVFREVRRVLRDDGTVWLNLGDSYGNRRGLHGIPWRVALALQEDGWHLRQDIIWHKPNPMPESIKNRCTKAHEYIFLLSKKAQYYYDHEAVKEPCNEDTRRRAAKGHTRCAGGNLDASGQDSATLRGEHAKAIDTRKWRNRRTVWTVTTRPCKGAHFATFPPDLIAPCILAGGPEQCCSGCGAPYKRVTCRGSDQPFVGDSEIDRYGTGEAGVHRKVGGAYQKWLDANPVRTVGFEATCECGAEHIGGTVLDPFGGSGTTAGVALAHGRNAILCELNPEYAEMVPERIQWILDYYGIDPEAIEQPDLFKEAE